LPVEAWQRVGSERFEFILIVAVESNDDRLQSAPRATVDLDDLACSGRRERHFGVAFVAVQGLPEAHPISDLYRHAREEAGDIRCDRRNCARGLAVTDGLLGLALDRDIQTLLDGYSHAIYLR
jgi:hypothetical protein